MQPCYTEEQRKIYKIQQQ